MLEREKMYDELKKEPPSAAKNRGYSFRFLGALSLSQCRDLVRASRPPRPPRQSRDRPPNSSPPHWSGRLSPLRWRTRWDLPLQAESVAVEASMEAAVASASAVAVAAAILRHWPACNLRRRLGRRRCSMLWRRFPTAATRRRPPRCTWTFPQTWTCPALRG